jgi:DNA-binding ferritin-like protein (Dps family)
MKLNEIEQIFKIGKKFDATHLLIIYNRNDDFYYSRYVKKGQNLDDVKKTCLGEGTTIYKIFDYNLDFKSQLNSEEKDLNRYETAIDYATKKHMNQYRKGVSHKEYITHPIEVSNLIEKYMKNDSEKEKYKVAAVLHDTIEDSDATYQEISTLFGEDIASIVDDVTSDKRLEKQLGKEVYLTEKLLSISSKSLTLKLCDRLHNVSSLNDVLDKFNEVYVNETLYLINFLLLYRNLEPIHLAIINDIMKKIPVVSIKPPIPRPKKLLNIKE